MKKTTLLTTCFLALVLVSGCRDLRSPEGALAVAQHGLKSNDLIRFASALSGDALALYGEQESFDALRDLFGGGGEATFQNLRQVGLTEVRDACTTESYRATVWSRPFFGAGFQATLICTRCLPSRHAMDDLDQYRICKIDRFTPHGIAE